jgi:hypothetical protein
MYVSVSAKQVHATTSIIHFLVMIWSNMSEMSREINPTTFILAMNISIVPIVFRTTP